MTAAPVTDSRLGILFMLSGMTLFTWNDALGKWLVADHPVAMLIAVRSLFGLAVLMPLILREGVANVFAVRRLPLHVLRVVVMTVDVACFYWAVGYLPLADVMTIYMSAPLIVTALSVLVLREAVGWRRWVAVLVGFVGVVIVLNPTGRFDLWPSLVALAGAFIFSCGVISTRMLRSASSLTLVGNQMVGGILIGGVALPFSWSLPGWADFLLLGLLGVSALAGHAMMNRSLQLSPAAVVVPFQYVSILWAVALDLVVWGTAPTARMGLGALLIIGSGLFIVYREQRLKRGVAGEGVPEVP
ncbi:DMT family transporter [Azospirillum picis]|uniref:Drug/metabolite transporter (DMT)-like permease n=1 Tax=Azospirillum picis TaxID=488438 RepID=A0ABU0MUC3_9PROT|nr:DMT family transporter [Azospirillum picis]MBP2299134.1 drug/metabolite transporter (DMT)-like permease [Azospirillum picis]MDQ0537060.1 drug/metabolite transporter (DMT)-like permease [Azospirillum picis]